MIHAVVLAAGASSRYGTTPPKQQELLPHVLAAVRRSSVDGILVVLGAHEIEVDAPAVTCPDWERGPGASLRCGLAALPEDVEAAVVVLADGPELDPRSIDRVIDSWRTEGGDVVAAAYDGTRLHPVLLARAAYDGTRLHPVLLARAAWAAVPDDGARALEARLVPCDDLAPPGDVDVRR